MEQEEGNRDLFIRHHFGAILDWIRETERDMAE
jgi:hypothetical protein